MLNSLRVTLDKGPGTNEFKQSFWLKALNKAFTRGSKTKKWQIEAKPTWHLFLEGKSIGLDQKTVLKGELLIWRTKNQARDQGIVQLKDSICFKSV
jgi:hypothetical protein